MIRAWTFGRGAAAATAAVAVVALAGHRRGWWDASKVLPVAGAALALFVVIELARSVALLRRSPRAPVAWGRALAFAGLALMLGGGLANWARSVRGFVLLVEGQQTALATAQLARGPLADSRELAASVRLVKVELRPAPGGGYYPESAVAVTVPGARPGIARIGPRATTPVGPLLLHQGAFGFAPRLVVLRGAETLLDQVVPFRSTLEPGRALSFEGEVEVPREKLTIRGAVNLDGLDADMKGHPRLALHVEKDGREVGAGELLPGHFAELPGGYRVGFAGLERWVEVDVARRSYREVVLAGLALAAAGLALWIVARLRS